MVLSEMNPVLLMLWREQHPNGTEQLFMDFNALPLQSEKVGLFDSLPSLEDLAEQNDAAGRAGNADEQK